MTALMGKSYIPYGAADFMMASMTLLRWSDDIITVEMMGILRGNTINNKNKSPVIITSVKKNLIYRTHAGISSSTFFPLSSMRKRKKKEKREKATHAVKPRAYS
jgi:hypothetical protein